MFLLLLLSFIIPKAKIQTVYPVFEDASRLYSDSLWIGKYEVTNKEYLTFVHQTNKKELEPNDSLWLTISNKQKAYETYYFRHPSYQNYPVVNISYQQAQSFCKWKSKQLDKLYKNFKITVRLPTEQEWEDGALGGNPRYSIYPWQEHSLRIKEGKHKGMFRCNFRTKSNEVYFIKNKKYAKEEPTVPVTAYNPNPIGLYNVCGNVAELIQNKKVTKGGSWNSFPEHLNIHAKEKQTAPSPFVGFRYVIEVRSLVP